MRVYLASRFGRRHELQGYAERLREAGFAVITSRWIYDADSPEYETITTQGAALCAQHDVEDVASADAVVVLTGPPSRGGYHVEFGIGLALGKKLVIVGEKENVFQHLEEVRQFETFDDFLFAIEAERSLAQLLGAA